MWPHSTNPAGSIGHTDVLGFGDLLHGLKDENIDLLLHSPGGDIDVAEKLVLSPINNNTAL